jgi:solute carrier family 25 (mitochondrial citrate transporter), member 1
LKNELFYQFKMSAMSAQGSNGKKPASPATNLIGKGSLSTGIFDCNTEIRTAGGGAGMMEALVCHPLGTLALGIDFRTERS